MTFVVGQHADALAEEYQVRHARRRRRLPGDLRAALRGHAAARTRWPPRRSASTSWASTAGRARAARGTRSCATRPSARAVHWAIDKRQIVATAMAGLAEPATSLISTGAGRLALGRARGRASTATIRRRPSRSSRTPATATATATACARTRPATSSRFRLVALDEYPEDQTAARMIVGWCRDVGIEPAARAAWTRPRSATRSSTTPTTTSSSGAGAATSTRASC